MRTRFVRAVVALLLLVGGFLAVAGVTSGPAAAARADCGGNGTPVFYFAGMTTQETTVAIRGVSASFIDAGDYLCSSITDSTNDVSSWTLVGSNSNPSNEGWAQSGQHYRWGEPCNRFFAQSVYNYPSTAPVTTEGPCVVTGATHLAWSQYDTGCACEKMLIDNALIAQTPWNPKITWASLQWQAQYMGETHYIGTDIPGTTSLHTHFWNMQYENDGGGFPSIAGNPALGLGGVVTHPRGTIAGVSADAIDVWTYAP